MWEHHIPALIDLIEGRGIQTSVFVEQPLDSPGLLNMQGRLVLLVTEQTLPDATPTLGKLHPVL